MLRTPATGKAQKKGEVLMSRCPELEKGKKRVRVRGIS
jgi:hypothetical protein